MMVYRTPAALEMAVREAARCSDFDTGRAIDSFYYHRFLCRVFNDSDTPFVLKGGRGILARTTKARYSRDADFAASEVSIDEAVALLVKSASADLDDFVTFDLIDSKPIRGEDDYREGVRLTFGVRMGMKSVQSITIDIVVDQVPREETESIVPVDRIDVKHLPVFNYRVLSVAYALADKYCAILERHGDRASSRVKDLIDILVYLGMENVEIRTFARKLEQEAAIRRIRLPERFSIPDIWFDRFEPVYARLIHEVALDSVYPSLEKAEDFAGTFYDRSRNEQAY